MTDNHDNNEQDVSLYEKLAARTAELLEDRNLLALTIDEQPHVGKLDGLHYALGCNGSGVAQMTYMGTQLARKIAGVANYRCAFDTDQFPTHPLYNGNKSLLVPMVGNYLRFRDWWDRKTG